MNETVIKTMKKFTLCLLTGLAFTTMTFASELQQVRHGTEKVGEIDIFYREAGDPKNPKVVLLHGYPSSSHQYRKLMAHLSDEYHLIAPDYPGMGNSGTPDPDKFTYNFDNLAGVIDQFLEQKKITKFSVMIQDWGAPVGFRIATKHPERIQSFIIQNGNAYEEGMSEKGWELIRKYWKNKTPELEEQIKKAAFSMEGLKWEYTHGTRHPESINPENWKLDWANIQKPHGKRIMLDLFYDYQNNLKLYPEWQAYLKKHQPPALIVWAKNDAYFPVPGAEGYKRDLKDVDYNILETGHFALEEDHVLIAKKARVFLKRITSQ